MRLPWLKRLVVESILASRASTAYCRADHPTEAFQAGRARARAKVLSGGWLCWRSSSWMTVRADWRGPPKWAAWLRPIRPSTAFTSTKGTGFTTMPNLSAVGNHLDGNQE